MKTLLQNYIKIDTSQPDPDYRKAIKLFKDQASIDGFQTQEITLSSGLPVLVITFVGTNKKLPALALNQHMDVVPALNLLDWKFPPFSGTIENNIIYGRGTQDMKGVGVAHYAALRQIKQNKINTLRTVHLILVPDEEVGGFNGARKLIQTQEFKNLNIKYILDEGLPSGDINNIFIKVSERKPLQIELSAAGNLAHGSKLHAFNALHELIKALTYFVKLQEKQQKKYKDPGLLRSNNITSCISGVIKDNATCLNIVPDKASATIDIRVPGNLSYNNVKKWLDNIMNKFPHVNYKILAQAYEVKNSNHKNSKLYKVIANIINTLGYKPVNLHFQASTDLQTYRSVGIEGFGLTPFTCLDNLHGTNENITLKDLELAIEVFYKIIASFCT